MTTAYIIHIYCRRILSTTKKKREIENNLSGKPPELIVEYSSTTKGARSHHVNKHDTGHSTRTQC